MTIASKEEMYLSVVIKVEILQPIDEVNIQELLDKYREEGKTEVIKAEVVSLTAEGFQKRWFGSENS